MPPFSVPGILVLPKERKRIGRHKLRASDQTFLPPVRPPPLRLGEEGTTSLSEARTDPLPLCLLSSRSPPAALFQCAVPKTPKRNLHQNRGDPPACPAGYSLNPLCTPTPQGEGCHRGNASLWAPITKKRGWEKSSNP